MSNTKEITKKRIEKERETLKSLDPKIYKVNFSEANGIVDVEVHQGKNNEQYNFSILLSELYPFKEPQVKLNLMPDQYTLLNTDDPKPLETFFKKPWTPNMTWKIIVQYVHRYMAAHVKQKPETEESTIFHILTDLCQKRLAKSALLIVLLVSLMYRVLCGFGGYSGVNDPPIFGDYEAQRHWMELTVNLHPLEWYIATPDNDLTYWRIDYPPLSAYISYICGYVSQMFDPASMELFKSRGYETPSHKLFMRGTVLFCDVVLLMSAIITLTIRMNKKYNYQTRLIYLFLILMTPLLALIDHGHFQYNCVMLGFMLWGLYFCVIGQIWLGSICFTLALNLKQMALYYALPFFCFILGSLFRKANLHIKSQAEAPALKIIQFVAQIFQVGMFVLGTMALLWWPWASSLDNILDVVKAIFPVKRGLYQLKVASFWCASDIIFKWQKLFSSELLVVLSMALTLVASVPSVVTLLRMPKFKYFKIALFNISMAFFFFSYHVHEKTILLPLMPFILNIRYFRHFYVDYILVATFTNYHMLVEDKLTLQYFVFTLTFAYFAYPLLDKLKLLWEKPEKQQIEEKNFYKSSIRLIERLYSALISKVIIAGMILLTILDKMVTPPEKYPYLFHLLFALLGFGQFLLVFVYSNLKMIESFNKDKAKENEAVTFTAKQDMGKND